MVTLFSFKNAHVVHKYAREIGKLLQLWEISRSPLFAELSLEFGNWVNEELSCVSVDIKSSHLKRIIFILTISLAKVP